MSNNKLGSGRRNRGPAAASENRRALIAAAREILAERGLDAPYSAIAARAGVGQGSLYRHFPNKMALAAAVFESNVDALEQCQNLEQLLDAIVAQLQMSAAFLTAALPSNDSPEMKRISERVVALVGTLLDADQAAGRVASDIDTQDVQVVILMLSRVALSIPSTEQAQVIDRARRLFDRILQPRDGRISSISETRNGVSGIE